MTVEWDPVRLSDPDLLDEDVLILPQTTYRIRIFMNPIKKVYLIEYFIRWRKCPFGDEGHSVQPLIERNTISGIYLYFYYLYTFFTRPLCTLSRLFGPLWRDRGGVPWGYRGHAHTSENKEHGLNCWRMEIDRMEDVKQGSHPLAQGASPWLRLCALLRCRLKEREPLAPCSEYIYINNILLVSKGGPFPREHCSRKHLAAVGVSMLWTFAFEGGWEALDGYNVWGPKSLLLSSTAFVSCTSTNLIDSRRMNKMHFDLQKVSFTQSSLHPVWLETEKKKTTKHAGWMVKLCVVVLCILAEGALLDIWCKRHKESSCRPSCSDYCSAGGGWARLHCLVSIVNEGEKQRPSWSPRKPRSTRETNLNEIRPGQTSRFRFKPNLNTK